GNLQSRWKYLFRAECLMAKRGGEGCCRCRNVQALQVGFMGRPQRHRLDSHGNAPRRRNHAPLDEPCLLASNSSPGVPCLSHARESLSLIQLASNRAALFAEKTAARSLHEKGARPSL